MRACRNPAICFNRDRSGRKLCKTQTSTDLRLRLLSNPKLTLSLNGRNRGTPRTGVPENVPLKACQCLDWGVIRSRPCGFSTGANPQCRTEQARGKSKTTVHKKLKTMKKIMHIVGKLAAACVVALGLISNVYGQNEVPYQQVPARTVDTNGATFLPDYSRVPSPPGGGPPAQNSPGATTDFQGLTDDNTWYPPDTHGAVGTNLVVTMLNTQVRILTRSGATVQTMTLPQFWTSTNIGSFTQVFDPRIVYDP